MRKIFIALPIMISLCLGIFYPRYEFGYQKITESLTIELLERHLFNKPRGVLFVQGSGGNRVGLCVDEGWHRIVFVEENQDDWIKAWGTYSTGTDGFRFPMGIAKDDNRNVYVADGGNGRIVKLRYDISEQELQYVNSFPIGGFGAVWDVDYFQDSIYVTDPVKGDGG